MFTAKASADMVKDASLASQLKEMRTRYTKATAKSRKAELELRKLQDELDYLRAQNETLRVTPLLTKAGRQNPRAGTVTAATSGGKSQNRVRYLETALRERDDELLKLKRSSNLMKVRELESMNEEYTHEINRLRTLIYEGKNEEGNKTPGVALFKLLETGANKKDRAFSKTGPKHRLAVENKRLRRSLEQEKDRYRRYLSSEIAADKLLEAELEPFRQGFSMGDIIEAQQKEIQKLRSEILTLHENNEVLQGSLGTALALQRVDSLATKGR